MRTERLSKANEHSLSLNQRLLISCFSASQHVLLSEVIILFELHNRLPPPFSSPVCLHRLARSEDSAHGVSLMNMLVDWSPVSDTLGGCSLQIILITDESAA